MTTHRAWVDESGSVHAHDPGTYILAAAISQNHQEDAIRGQVERLRLRGQVKLHWRAESEQRRTAISRVLADLDIEHLVVVRSSADHERLERRRRKCLERLLCELEARSVTDVTLESRGKRDDRRDIEMLNALRSHKTVSSALRLTHVVGRSEAMLWIPDAVCGATTSARTGTGTYLELFKGRLTVVEI